MSKYYLYSNRTIEVFYVKILHKFGVISVAESRWIRHNWHEET